MPLYTVPGSFAQEDRKETYATNRTGSTLSKGDVVAFDLTGSDSDVDAYTTTATDPFANVISVATAHLTGWIFAVALETIGDDESGLFLLRGIDDVSVLDNSASSGDSVAPGNGSTSVDALTDGEVCVGNLLEAAPGSGGAATKKVLFDGDCRKGAAGSAT